jgi:hypothetical protein
MKRLITTLVAAAAVTALSAGSASAFDGVNWTWEKDVREHVNIWVDINVCNDPTGLVEVEKLQIFLGNVSAYSKVAFVNNDMYDPGGHWDFSWCWRAEWIPNSFDARVDLPSVISTAVAVGNNQSITSDVPVYLHDGQFVANTNGNYVDGCDWCNMAGIAGDNVSPDTQTTASGNTYTELAALFTLGAVVGVLTPSDISASSEVFAIHNATVDSSATAVANNISVNLASNDPNNHVLIADITQFAYANVSAVSDVCNVTVENFRNLSPDANNTDPTLSTTLGRPLVSSVATAVGNNVSISVGPVAP